MQRLNASICITDCRHRLQGSEPGRVVLERGSFLKSIDAFDYLEFGITHKDALSMSPSTRKLLELSFLSLLDSGIPYRGKNIGCFAAGIIHDVLALGDAVSHTYTIFGYFLLTFVSIG